MVPRFSVRPCPLLSYVTLHANAVYSTPTALDALLFAYLHVLARSSEQTLRYEVVRRANLAGWEMRVQKEVKAAFRRYV